MPFPPIPKTPAPSDPAARLAKAKAIIGGARVATTGAHSNVYLSDDWIKEAVKAAGGKLSAPKNATVLLVGARPPDDTGAHEAVIRGARDRGAVVVEGDLAAEAVGAPLFVERLTQSLKTIGQKHNTKRALKYWHIGDPATPAALAEAEARIGMPLDSALRRLYLQANGLTFGYRCFSSREKLKDRVVTPVPGPYSIELFLGVTYTRDLWDREPGMVTGLTLNIPPIEELFTRHRLVDVLPRDGSMKIGTKMCPAEQVRDRLFLFDANCAYTPIFLYLDPEAGTMELVVGHDYGVSLGDYPSITVGAYLDQLDTGLSPAARFGAHHVRRGYHPE